MNDKDWFARLETLNKQAHNLLQVLKQKFPELKFVVTPDKIRGVPIVNAQLRKCLWQFTIVDNGNVVAEVLQPIKGHIYFLERIYLTDIDSYIKELALVKDIQNCIKYNWKTIMNTINYDSRNYTFYQFWGELVAQTGFNVLDYQSMTLDEQAQMIASDILENNVLIDYDGVPTDFNTVLYSVTNILEGNNVLSE